MKVQNTYNLIHELRSYLVESVGSFAFAWYIQDQYLG